MKAFNLKENPREQGNYDHICTHTQKKNKKERDRGERSSENH
jgi:hypothetical protein